MNPETMPSPARPGPPPERHVHQPVVVQKRVNLRGRRRLVNLSPLGLFLFDATIAAFSIIVGYVVSPYVGLNWRSSDLQVTCLAAASSYAALVSIYAHIAGLHDRRFPRRLMNLVGTTTAVIGLSLTTLVIAWLVTYFGTIGRFVLLFAIVISWVGMAGARALTWYLAKNFAQTVCFLGDDDFCFGAVQFLTSHASPLKVKTFQDFERHAPPMSLGEWAIENGVDELVYIPGTDVTEDVELLGCLDEGIKISAYSDFIEENFLQVPVEQIDATWLFSARLDLAHPLYHGIKRLFDMLVALVGLIITGPLMILAIILVKLESAGPAIYSQVRIGRFNHEFRIYKLRTMVADAEKNGAQWAATQDNRITKIGGILRRTRLDEVPQFWNVLMGEMSLVGPRPERPNFVAMLGEKIPFYVQRHLVKPGLTGWAQINYPYGASVEDALNKLTYDLYYVKRASLGLDLRILLRTLGALMKGSR